MLLEVMVDHDSGCCHGRRTYAPLHLLTDINCLPTGPCLESLEVMNSLE
jgi:hypothetical protein